MYSVYAEQIYHANDKNLVVDILNEVDNDSRLTNDERMSLKRLMLDKQILLTIREG